MNLGYVLFEFREKKRVGRRRVFKGERLRLSREAKGLTQDDLADRANLGQSQLNRYENSKSEPTLDVVIRLAEVLDVSVEWLLGVVDDPLARLKISDLSAAERRLINAYRSREVQEMLRIIMDASEKPQHGRE